VNKTKSTDSFLLPIQDSLAHVEKKMREQTTNYHPDIAAALQQIFSSGGKRIRPAVTLLTGGMLKGDPEKLVTLSAAIELLHTATLVHDDLIDGALLRRGNATLNAKWSPAATVLTGDFVFARAAKLAADTDSVAVMRLFSETLSLIVNGELIQQLSSRGLATWADYEQRIYAKTASMFELSTSAAALLSPVSSAVVGRMRAFGYSIGMAFQIIDDVIDFTGDASSVGKPVAADLRQGLITLPALLFFESFPQNHEMSELINRGEISEGGFESLVRSIRNSDAISQSIEKAGFFVERSLKILKDMPDTMERAALAELANYIIDRDL